MSKLSMKFVLLEQQSVLKKEKNRPASYVRREFEVRKNLTKAILYMTALGVYRGYINGKALDNRLLLPGFTNYNARLQVQDYDVTKQLYEGQNVISVIVGEGWYRGSMGVNSNKNYYGDALALAAKLELLYADGQVEIIETDASWRATQSGPLRTNDIKTYETYDARMELQNWMKAGYNTKNWHHCVPTSYSGLLIQHEGCPVTEHESFVGQGIVTPNGETVIDFGQNLAGHVEFTVTGKAGDQVILEMGETLDENGNFTVKNLTSDQSTDLIKSSLGQTLTYILKDGTQTYKSQFLISGYRYVRVSNWPEKVEGQNFRSIAVYSDMEKTGDFECSNPKINQFVSNSRWSWKSNSVDIPTDCPTRERAGWTGDINVYCETAAYSFDIRQFLRKYLVDFMTHQEANGSLPYIVPELEILPGKLNHVPYSSAGWSDALINIPMIMYQFYGGVDYMELVYESAKKYVDYNIKRSKKGRKKYLLDSGFHWGEWLEPNHPMPKDIMTAIFKPDAEVATAWLYQSTCQLSEMAKLLGREEDSVQYGALANEIKNAYRKEYLSTGKVVSDRQCKYVRPVFMGLASGEEAGKIVSDLNELVINNDFKIGTGFLTTYKILQTLTDYGFIDTAYKLMENEACPGWLYEVCKGATTTWENWEGINEQGVPNNSLNHYAPGAAVAWLYSYVGGIRPAAPGFKEVLIQPVPGGTLTYAKTSYDSIQGTISTDWSISDNTFSLHVEVPEGVPTEVVLPNGQKYTQTEKAANYTCILQSN